MLPAAVVVADAIAAACNVAAVAVAVTAVANVDVVAVAVVVRKARVLARLPLPLALALALALHLHLHLLSSSSSRLDSTLAAPLMKTPNEASSTVCIVISRRRPSVRFPRQLFLHLIQAQLNVFLDSGNGVSNKYQQSVARLRNTL